MIGPALMIVFRRKYPRWWFDWNLQLWRFQNRVAACMLLRDEYPAADDDQAVHLDVAYPDVSRDLNQWMPLVKWLLATPLIVVLCSSTSRPSSSLCSRGSPSCSRVAIGWSV